jgi:MarR family 2-MHQ and catechol resistance regulon transcriptional repressor
MPTRYKGTPDEVLALDTIIKLSRSLNSVQARLTPQLQKEFGITESQFGVLEALLHLGPMPLGQLCHKILRSGSNLTTIVDNLERDGLVTRVRDEGDRRVQIAELTEKGREVIARAFPVHASRVTSLMSTLTDEEQRELGRICRKLGTAVSE